MGKGRCGKGQLCLAILTRKPGREEMVLLSDFLSEGTAFKPGFNITDVEASHTQDRAHTLNSSRRAKKLNIPNELVGRDKRQSPSLILSTHRGTSENREKAHCTDSLHIPPGFNRSWWHLQKLPQAFHLIRPLASFL